MIEVICGKSQPCLNGGTCNKVSGLCNCVASFVGELCQLPAGKNIEEHPSRNLINHSYESYLSCVEINAAPVDLFVFCV